MYFFRLLGTPAIIHHDLGETKRAVIIFLIWDKFNNMFGLLFHPSIILKNLAILSYNHGVICIIDAAYNLVFSLLASTGRQRYLLTNKAWVPAWLLYATQMCTIEDQGDIAYHFLLPI